MEISKLNKNMLSDYSNIVKNVHNQPKKTENSENIKDNTSFGTCFSNAMDKLDENIQNSENNVPKILTGELDDLHTMMIDMTKSQLSLQGAVQVRNKCLEAYNELKNMQF